MWKTMNWSNCSTSDDLPCCGKRDDSDEEIQGQVAASLNALEVPSRITTQNQINVSFNCGPI